MTRRRRDTNPIDAELRRAAGAAACAAGFHMAPNRKGKCPRCKAKLSALESGGSGGFFAVLFGLFMQGLHHGQQTAASDGYGHVADYRKTPYPPRTAPLIDWRRVLGFRDFYYPSREEIQQRYRELAKQHHPDRGGSAEKFKQITAARDAALKELSA